MKTLKKITSIIASATLLSTMLASGTVFANESENITGTLSAANLECAPGQKIAVNIDVTADNNFEAFDLSLYYGEDLIAESATSAGEASVSSEVFSSEGYLNITAFGTSAIKDGTIAKVIFTVPEDAETGVIYDLAFKVKTFSTIDADITGNIIVKTGEIKVSKKLGDANGDETINVRDAACLARLLSDKSPSTELPLWADFNNDMVINVRDCAAIARMLAGKNR